MLHRSSTPHVFFLIAVGSLLAAGCTGPADKGSEKASMPAEKSTPTKTAEKPAPPAEPSKSAKPTEKTALPAETSKPAADSLLTLSATTLEGQLVDLSAYKGKVALVVNVASQCGFTPQYAGLETLYKELEPKGFVILAFPSNDFGGQEPGSAADIQKFCTEKYSVTFPMFVKIETKSGPSQSPVYKYLGAATGKLPTWNFCKYLVGKDGKVIEFFPSKVKPDDPELKKAIETALASK
jgi:glutathione peroxidase